MVQALRNDVRTMVVTIPVADIVDWDTFHDAFARTMGFPDFYGRNMNAWIDCMTDADADTDIIPHPVEPGELLTLRLQDADGFAERCPEQYAALIECSAFVNYRRVEQGGTAVLSLLLEGRFRASPVSR